MNRWVRRAGHTVSVADCHSYPAHTVLFDTFMCIHPLHIPVLSAITGKVKVRIMRTPGCT